MAITRAQQAKQMLQDGGMLVKPGRGKRPGYRGDDAAKASGRSKGQATSRDTTRAESDRSGTGDTFDRGKFQEAVVRGKVKSLIERDEEEKGRGIDPKTGLSRANLESIQSLGLSRFNFPGVGGMALNALLPFRRFTLEKNKDYFTGLQSRAIGTKRGITRYAPTADGYKQYMADRLAGKIDAAGNLAPGFMEGPGGEIISTGNDGRDDAIIPVMAKAMEEEDVADEDELIFPDLTRRILGGELKRDIAAEGGRIGYDDGGMLVQPGFGGTRQGYRSAKAQESKQKSAREYKASTTQQQRDDDRRNFQEQRKQAVQRLEEVKPTSSRRRGIENAVRTASELNYLRNLYKLDPVGLGLSFVGNKISDFLFSPAGAAELSEEEQNILRATGQLENQKQKILDATGIGSGAAGVGEVPDLTDPTVSGPIAEAGGLTTTPERVGGLNIGDMFKIGGETINVPTSRSLEILKEAQEEKRGKGVTRDEFIKNAPASMTNPGAVYDLVQADQISDQLPRTLAAEGGIMDLGRQELFLGGIAKGLKKAARGVSRTLKKVAKSPIGKAALFAGLAGIPFGGGKFFGSGSLFGKAKPFLMDSLFGKVTDLGISGSNRAARVGGILDFIKNNPTLAIGGASLLAGALTPKEEDNQDEFLRQYYDMRLDPSLSVRGTGSEFDFYKPQFVADGGRIGFQEGSKEPVAKKTMPLLDMDGQEMDLRDNGGFVPIGRMEKADDVPARLSKNEFVFTADAVRNAGDGDVDKGAEVMYNMMKNLERGGNVSDESQGLEGAREMFQTSKRLEEVL